MSRRGVSLMELLVVVGVGSVITGSVVMALMGQLQLSSTQNRTMINQQNLRETLDYMGEEISSIGSGAAEPFLDIADAEELRFVSDIDGDGDWNRVRYYLATGNLRRQLWTSADAGANWTAVSDDVVITGVTDLTFNYFSAGNGVPANQNEITLIEVRLTQDTEAETTRFNTGKVPGGSMAIRATIRNRTI